MKIFFTKIAATLAAAVLAVACTPTRTTKSAGEQVDDSAVTARVKSVLARDPATSAFQIDVETFRGTVQLNGFVETAEMKSAAGKVVGTVEGVRNVDNNLRIGPSQRTAGEYLDDKLITGKVKLALANDPVVSARQVNVEVREGVVQLAGFVDTAAEKAKAGEVARAVGGVKDVRNDLEVKN